MATGFIGIGIMGEGMAGCLLKAGKKLVVWNRESGVDQRRCRFAVLYTGSGRTVDGPWQPD